MTGALLLFDKEVVLDGETNLIIDGADSHPMIEVARDVTVGLRALTVTGGGNCDGSRGGGGITNSGTLHLSRVSVQDNASGGCVAGGIFSLGAITIAHSAITGNTGMALAAADATLTNSTIAGNVSVPLGGAIWSLGSIRLVNCTVSEIEAFVGGRASGPTMTHALGEGSVAINVIPEVDCVDADGEPLTPSRSSIISSEASPATTSSIR